ncbi:MAG: DUF1615 domain-containing protein [Steroidobacteraceae bacterium]
MGLRLPASTHVPGFLRLFAGIAAVLLGLAGCVSPSERVEVDPDRARHAIVTLMPAKVADAQGWADDIFAAFDALEIKPTAQNICAVLAVTEQESTFQVDPAVSGLPAMARREIDGRAARFGIPKLLVSGALALPSPNGQSYSERLSKVKTERELSLIFEDFIGMVPLGQRLFGSLNPVRTGGPMQVSIAFAHEHADTHKYPYSDSPDIRHEVFTRRGGLYFGIAHLLDYPVAYDRMLYRFADFNAGHYASRNAAFQNAVTIASKTKLALDGDLILYGRDDEPSKTEQTVRTLVSRLEMNDEQIHRDLERGKDEAFENSKLYRRVFELADEVQGSAVPRALVPRIRLESVKITRELTTDWFAQRVDQRYRKCLARGSAATTSP